MMNIEKIFNRLSFFENITMDFILFESRYPVLFTCQKENVIYLFICCLVNADKIIWIGTETDYETLIALLENKITIRNAFLGVVDRKFIIEYNGRDVCGNIVKKGEIPDHFLPTAGEYMDAEEDEYAEELSAFKFRNRNVEYKIQTQVHRLWMVHFSGNIVIFQDEYFHVDDFETDAVELKLGEIWRRNISFV